MSDVIKIYKQEIENLEKKWGFQNQIEEYKMKISIELDYIEEEKQRKKTTWTTQSTKHIKSNKPRKIYMNTIPRKKWELIWSINKKDITEEMTEREVEFWIENK